MIRLKIIGLYLLAVPVFLWSYLRGQGDALHYAWLDSFASVPKYSTRLREKR